MIPTIILVVACFWIIVLSKIKKRYNTLSRQRILIITDEITSVKDLHSEPESTISVHVLSRGTGLYYVILGHFLFTDGFLSSDTVSFTKETTNKILEDLKAEYPDCTVKIITDDRLSF